MMTALAGFIIGVLTTVGGAYGIISHNVQLGATSVLKVFQGGTGASSFSPNSLIASGANSTDALSATTTSPLVVGSIVATTTATSTYAGGISTAGLAVTGNTGCASFGAGGYLTGSGSNCGTGTVTSVDGSGGTTGLTLTGGPITTSGTLTIGGTLGIANGGTNATSYGTSNGILAYNGSAFTTYAGYTLVNGLLTATNATTTQFTSGNNTFYIDSNGRLQAKDTTNNWSGVLSPTRSFVLSTATTTTWTSSTTNSAYSPYLIMPFTGTLRQVRCSTDSFLGVNVTIGGSNVTPPYFVASSTVGLIGFTTGNTFTTGQKILANFGTSTTASATSISCTFDVTETY